MGLTPPSGPGGGGVTPTLAQVLAAGASAGGVAITNLGAPSAQAAAARLSDVGGVGWTDVVKAADESVASSIAVQPDDELFFTPANGGSYEIELALIYASPAGGATPDLSWGFYADATKRGSYCCVYLNLTDVSTIAANDMVSGSLQTAGTAATNREVRVWGWLLGAGTQFTLQWAQQTSNASPTIMRAGSTLRYRRLL